MAVECGEKWEVGVDALCVQFQVSLQSEGLLTLSTLPLFLVCEKMSLFNVSPHCFLPCELFTTMETMVLLSWFLEWILGWHLMNLSHVSFEILRRDGILANATFNYHRYFWLTSLTSSVFYKILKIGKLF